MVISLKTNICSFCLIKELTHSTNVVVSSSLILRGVFKDIDNTKPAINLARLFLFMPELCKFLFISKENFFDFLKLELPPTTENHTKYRDAIKHTIKELNSLDIKNAMASGKDVLGEFPTCFIVVFCYFIDVFLKAITLTHIITTIAPKYHIYKSQGYHFIVLLYTK
jgi:hypothetical protein